MTFDNIVWWTGACTLGVLFLVFVWLVQEFAWAFVCTVSWARWSHRVMVVHQRKPNWPAFPRTFFSQWWAFVGYRAGNSTWHGEGGQWRGVFDWEVYPPKKAD